MGVGRSIGGLLGGGNTTGVFGGGPGGRKLRLGPKFMPELGKALRGSVLSNGGWLTGRDIMRDSGNT